ncbi:MAG TPA: hypothetical protein VM386_00380, partial [Acidimicrobiales bacterium]|nr:hypothetical protein [Acidimicrobiales bacterium]
MLRYARGRGLLRCGEAWFDEDVEADGIDILEYVQISSPPRNLQSEPFPTLLIDLEPSPEEILAGFDKTTRYEVRRGLGRDGVRTMWHPDVDDELLQRFISDYERFARARQLPPASRRRLDAMRAARALVLSRAELDGAAHAWHAYIRVDDRVRLLLSSTADRSSSTELRAQIGRSNRALHYADAVAAKEAGARWLD